MDIEVTLFATFREAVGEKTLHRRHPEGAHVGAVLEALVDEYPDLDVFADGDIHPYVNVLLNGTNINQLDGLDTSLDDGDSVSVFPPVEGGWH